MKKLFLHSILLWLMVCSILVTRAYSQDITLQQVTNKGVIFYAIGNDEIIMTVRTQSEADTFWFLLKEYDNKNLGTNLSSFMEVNNIQSSPDGKYLAVLSVGEGHPTLEVVDLQKLRAKQEYKVLHEINPYPGIIYIEHWEGSNLIISSDLPLPIKKENGHIKSNPTPLLPDPIQYSLNPSTGTITSFTPAPNPNH